ncbi:MAG TPA: FAD binding domain-containing protein [Candidatus Dormibacteraeota bacterium]|nr:FAD binding domain-containing protein [Candidatus Dormibacteraeota bacterium]
MPDFFRPATVDEALADLGRDRAVALAGGTQVAMPMTAGLVDVDALVWLGCIDELRGIAVDRDRMTIGAGVTLFELASSSEIKRLHPALAEAAAGIGNPRVRAAATIGGHLAHADPRQDLPPLLMVLGAVVLIAGHDGNRRVPLTEFFTGFMSTALEPGELLTGVELPAAPQNRRAGYVRFAPVSASDYAAVGVAGAVTVRDGNVVEATLALGAGSSTARVVPAAGFALLGRPGDAEIARASQAIEAAADPVADQRGSIAYKRAMAGLWTRRLIQRLLA